MLRLSQLPSQLGHLRRSLSSLAQSIPPAIEPDLNIFALSTKEDVDAALAHMRNAQEHFMSYKQNQVDKIFEESALAARLHAMELAQYAVKESGIGLVEDKVLKNLYASEYSVHQVRG